MGRENHLDRGADDIRKLARMFATTKGAAIYQGTCTQDPQANGTQTNRAIAILRRPSWGGINVPGGWVLSPRLALKNIFLPTKGDGQPLGTDKYPLILSTGQRDLFYTASQMHHVDWLRKHRPFAVAEMASQTAAKYNITDGQEVYVVTDHGQSRSTPRSTIALPTA